MHDHRPDPDAGRLGDLRPHHVGGDVSAGADWRQIAFRSRIALDPHALGVDGVYACSSATPPDAGVHGVDGFHAAETAVARL